MKANKRENGRIIVKALKGSFLSKQSNLSYDKVSLDSIKSVIGKLDVGRKRSRVHA